MNISEAAQLFYTVYCKEVGGEAFNGDTLPSANEFFNDPTKSKQSAAYIEAMTAVITKLHYDTKPGK